MDVLVVTTVHADAPRTGSEIVSAAFFRALAAGGHDVTVLGYHRPADPAPAVPGWVDAGARHIETAGAPAPVKAAWMAEALRRRLPYSAAKYRSRRYLALAREALATADVLVVDHAQMGWVVDELAPTVPVVFLAHNVEHHLYAAQRDTSGNPAGRWVHGREARLVRDLEHRLAADAHQVWALTADDAEELGASAPGRVRTFAVPGVDTGPLPDVERTRDVAVLGTWTWEPNAEGLRWLCDHVVPRLGGRTVHIGGAGAEWAAAVPGVTYHGRVPDAGAFLAAARVVAVPARAGSGVQVKTLDALGAGAWLVATPLALRGIDAGPDVARVADEPGSFAAAVEDLLGDERTAAPNPAALDWIRPRRARFEADVAAALADIQRSA